MTEPTIPSIEQFQNAAWAVILDDGIAIYPSSDEAVEALRDGTAEASDADWEYYHELGAYAWYPCPELTAEALEGREEQGCPDDYPTFDASRLFPW